MVLWNLLDGGPSHSRPLLGPSVSLWGGTLDTNPHQLDGAGSRLAHPHHPPHGKA
jgi:hypothetical protein